MSMITQYQETGGGMPLVLIHAFPFNADMWEPQRRELSGAHRIITFDLPGFGRDAGHACASLEECADHVAALLDRLEIDRCVLGGCSMGGYIAMAFLRRHGGRARGVVLANTRAGADSADARANRRAQATDVRANGTTSLIDGLLPRLLSGASREADPGLEDRVRSIMRDATPEATARMLEAMAARPDSFDVITALDIPVCIIVGEHDALTPPAEARLMAEAIRGSALHIVPGVGHLTNLEAPATFNRIVADFMMGLG